MKHNELIKQIEDKIDYLHGRLDVYPLPSLQYKIVEDYINDLENIIEELQLEKSEKCEICKEMTLNNLGQKYPDDWYGAYFLNGFGVNKKYANYCPHCGHKLR